MMDHHDIRESKKVIESEYVVQRRGGMTAHVPHDHGIWWQSVDERSSSIY